jgi:hypothetical protein
VRQAARREQRQLLAAHQAVQQVDGRHTGLDEVARQRAPRRVDREPLDPHSRARRDRRATVDRAPDAVEDAAEQVRAHAEQQRLRAQAHARVAEAEARRQRAQLLRSFEQSPLSKANFGALKGLSEAALDALLTQARQDRERR